MIYELHVGTFTPEGTLDAAIGKLDHLVDLGVDAVELLPVNGFNGDHNWGYDGVAWYTVDESYGGPEAYQRFVDACHTKGIAVIQDVVYNHLGPSGNYLPLFAEYFKPGASSWGDLINLDGWGSDGVREYILDNITMWLREYHVDGFRLDAVHALADSRATHILEQIAQRIAAESERTGKELVAIAESDLNDPRMIAGTEGHGLGMDAQWLDDVHHAAHVAFTGETHGYYGDFASLHALEKTMHTAYFHNGTYSTFRGRSHGREIDPVEQRASLSRRRFLGGGPAPTQGGGNRDFVSQGGGARSDRYSSGGGQRGGSRGGRGGGADGAVTRLTRSFRGTRHLVGPFPGTGAAARRSTAKR